MKRPIKGTYSPAGCEIKYKLYCGEDGVWWLSCSGVGILDLCLDTSCSSIALNKAKAAMLDAYNGVKRS